MKLRFELQPDMGFGTWLYVRIGKLWLTWGAYQGNWYVSLMWA